MKREGFANAALLTFTLLVGSSLWWLELRPPLRVDASQLGALPMQIGDFAGEAIPVEDTVERILRADFNVQRSYERGSESEPVLLYVGYYGTERGGRPEHTPDQCYPSAGWRIETQGEFALDGLRGNEWVVSQEDARQLVVFWYQSVRKTGMRDNLELSVDHLTGRLRDGRADGALVRLSTPLTPDVETARRRLVDFAQALGPVLAARWPNEFPAGTP